MAEFAVGRETYPELRKALAPQLPAYLLQQRWFGGKARTIDAADVTDVIPVGSEASQAFVAVVSVKYADGSDESYAMPLLRVTDSAASMATNSDSLRLPTSTASAPVVLTDGLKDEEFLAALLALIDQSAVVRGEKGELRGTQTTAYSKLNSSLASPLRPKPVGAEQSNTSIVYGGRLIMKFFRRIQEGVNPDIEIGKFLTEKTSFTSVPPLAGLLEYHTRDGKQMAQGMLQAFVPNQGDAWAFTLDSLAEFYDAVGKHSGTELGPAGLANSASLQSDVPEFACSAVGPYLAATELLGKRTAEMHLALASEPRDPAFVPEPFTMEFQRSLEQSMLSLLARVFALLRDKIASLPSEWRSKAEELAGREQEIARRFHAALSEPILAMRSRIHGDYHLGQVLRTGSDFVIIDFEGEPARPIAERRVKRSPLQDVAGMLRSFHYAAFAPLLGENKMQAEDVRRLSGWAESWAAWVTKRFLAKYFETAGSALYLPQSPNETQKILELHLLEKAIYELGYELNNRPTWVGIPLPGIAKLLSQ
jgi:maltose alpha-D-glucosyltransferase/alpha-amylase